MAKCDVDFDSLTNDIVIYDIDNDIIRTPAMYRQGKILILSHHDYLN
jgi:hypothetical protein